MLCELGSEEMAEKNNSKSLALALLAIPAGAIVTVTQAEGGFGPWEIPIGALIIFVTLAYENSISDRLLETAAFSIMLGAGLLCSFGFIIEIAVGSSSSLSKDWCLVISWTSFSVAAGLVRPWLRKVIEEQKL